MTSTFWTQLVHLIYKHKLYTYWESHSETDPTHLYKIQYFITLRTFFHRWNQTTEYRNTWCIHYRCSLLKFILHNENSSLGNDQHSFAIRLRCEARRSCQPSPRESSSSSPSSSTPCAKFKSAKDRLQRLSVVAKRDRDRNLLVTRWAPVQNVYVSFERHRSACWASDKLKIRRRIVSDFANFWYSRVSRCLHNRYVMWNSSGLFQISISARGASGLYNFQIWYASYFYWVIFKSIHVLLSFFHSLSIHYWKM